MADPHNLSADALVRKVLTDEHADLVREAVSFLCHQIMEAEVSAQIGAGLGERAPEARATHRETATASGALTPAPARSSSSSPSCDTAPTSRPSWSRAPAPSRRWSLW
jgi:hypothetical protein